MKQVSLYEAKSQLSALVEAASLGQEIVIAKNGKPKARLVPAGASSPAKAPRKLGQWAKGGPKPDREKWLADWKSADADIARDFEQSLAGKRKNARPKGARK
jgi:prevent-host-death family protein